jgi:hypothetical protein
MPFSSLFTPSLPLSQFKAQLNANNMPCRLFNLNFEFARQIGFENYEPMFHGRNIEIRLGEWIFAKEAWGCDFGPAHEEFFALLHADKSGGRVGHSIHLQFPK